jgi:hypothetical protein
MSTGLSCTRVAVLAVTETAEIITHSKLTHRGVIEDNVAHPRASAGIAQIRKPRTSGEVRGDARFVLLTKKVQEVPTTVGRGPEHLVPVR